MRRLVPLLGAVLALALSGTAAADNFAVVRPHRGGTIAFSSGGATSSVAATQSGPMSFAALRGIWQSAGNAYGIPWEVLAAINKVETNFGANLGPSSAGAVGWMQFMPSTWARWGMDANGDGVADPNNPVDAIFSAARYLAACGGQTDIAAAVYCYNHATWYVNDVLSLAALYAQGGVGGAGLFSVDQLQMVASARSEVAAAKTQLASAGAKAEKLAHAQRRFLHAAATAPLLSDQLEAGKRAAQLGARRYEAEVRVARLREVLSSATTRLRNAQNPVSNVAFGAGGSQLLSATAGAGGLQFGRIDQGVDITSYSPYPALAPGRVVHIDPNFWQGTPAVYEKLDTPIMVGGRIYDEIYYAETPALVHVGQRLMAGQSVIAPGSAEIGFARGGLPAAHGTYTEGVPTQAGSDFYTYITAGNPAGDWTSGDPLSFQLGAPSRTVRFRSAAEGATTLSATSDTTAFTPNVVYFTH